MLKCRKCPACVFVEELAPAMLPSQFCERHAGMSLPLGANGSIVVPDSAWRGDRFAEPRWHEIATEGLPPRTEDGFYWTWDGRYVSLRNWVAGTDTDNPEWAEDNEVVKDQGRITHWYPIVKPAPPTKEPR